MGLASHADAVAHSEGVDALVQVGQVDRCQRERRKHHFAVRQVLLRLGQQVLRQGDVVPHHRLGNDAAESHRVIVLQEVEAVVHALDGDALAGRFILRTIWHDDCGEVCVLAGAGKVEKVVPELDHLTALILQVGVPVDHTLAVGVCRKNKIPTDALHQLVQYVGYLLRALALQSHIVVRVGRRYGASLELLERLHLRIVQVDKVLKDNSRAVLEKVRSHDSVPEEAPLTLAGNGASVVVVVRRIQRTASEQQHTVAVDGHDGAVACVYVIGRMVRRHHDGRRATHIDPYCDG